MLIRCIVSCLNDDDSISAKQFTEPYSYSLTLARSAQTVPSLPSIELKMHKLLLPFLAIPATKSTP